MHYFTSTSRFFLFGIAICTTFALIYLLYISWNTSGLLFQPRERKPAASRLNRPVCSGNFIDYLVKPGLSPFLIPNLPKLQQLKWSEEEFAPAPNGRRDSKGKVIPLPAVFEPVFSMGQKKLARRLLHIFSELMFANGLGDQFMLHGGTLLGSFRHHDIIPWDDDLDLLVNEAVRSKVEQILKQLEPNYILKIQSQRGKLHTKLHNLTETSEDTEFSSHSSEYSWGWPYLDLSYYKINGTKVKELATSYGRSYTWNYSTIFPLRFRPLGSFWYPAPNDPLQFLLEAYEPTTKCAIFGYSHVLEAGGPYGKKECSELAHRYAFVEHRPHRLAANSSLQGNDTVWNNERLIQLRSFGGSHRLIHELCLPAPKHNSEAITYGIDHRH